MKKLTLTAFLLLLAAQIEAQPLISAHTDSLIREGIRLGIDQAYPEALALFAQLAENQPENPAGHFFCAAVLQTKMMDYEDYGEEKAFLSHVHKTISLARACLRRGQDKAWAYFFLGGAYGYLAFHQGKKQQFIQAFENGRRSISFLQKAIETDSTLYDAYFGIGTYKYYRSKFSRFFSWLPFVKDERAEGIQMIETALARSRYSRTSALNGLCWILIDEQKYEEAWSHIQPVLQEFPRSRVFLWCGAKLAKKLQRWHTAARYYERILATFRDEAVSSPYNEMVCRKNLSALYLRLEDYGKARQECRLLSELRPGLPQDKAAKKAWKEARKVCQEVESSLVLGKAAEPGDAGSAQD